MLTIKPLTIRGNLKHNGITNLVTNTCPFQSTHQLCYNINKCHVSYVPMKQIFYKKLETCSITVHEKPKRKNITGDASWRHSVDTSVATARLFCTTPRFSGVHERPPKTVQWKWKGLNAQLTGSTIWWWWSILESWQGPWIHRVKTGITERMVHRWILWY